MKNTDLLREKLAYYGKLIIDREKLLQIMSKWVPTYTIAEASKRKIVSPLKKGSYYFIHSPSSGGTRRELSISLPYEIGGYYCSGIPYAFGGLEIYNKYGFTTQLAERYTIYNTQYVGEKKIGKYRYRFKKVRESFFWGVRKSKELNAVVLSPERALIQLVKEGGSLEFLKKKPRSIDAQLLLKLATKYTSQNLLSKIKHLTDSWHDQ